MALRFSRAIAAIACKVFKLVVVEFFDDFTQLEPEKSSDSAMLALESMLKLLGWRIATTEAKRKPFAKDFISLGVQVNLECSTEGTVMLQHKPGRVLSLHEQVEQIIESKNMRFKDALSVRGRIYFCEGQVYGRVGAPVIHMLTRWLDKFLNHRV